MRYKQNCNHCDKEFESDKPAKYCTNNCRVTAHRSVTAEPKIVTADVTATNIGFGPNDFTRKMVEENLNRGDTFAPNWYGLGFKSKNEAKEKMGWNKLV